MINEENCEKTNKKRIEPKKTGEKKSLEGGRKKGK